MLNFSKINAAKLFYFVAPLIIAVFIASIWGSPLDGYGKTTILQKIFIDYFILTILFSAPIFFVVYLILSLFFYASGWGLSSDNGVVMAYALGLCFNVFLGYVQWFYLAPKFFRLISHYISNGRSQLCRATQVILVLLVLAAAVTIIYIIKF